MSEYVPTIGLEVHAELKTKTKMFCDSKNDPFDATPNSNICPVCLSHPGTLPVINREAVRHVLRVGVALGGTLADYTEFDRKNYFYPDLPKGYQISQYEYPLVQGGSLNGVAITRVHLEEDTASSIHDEDVGSTTIDFNRAGVPLMELVTEPVIKSSKAAGDFGRELQLLLRTLGASDASMEKGQMRVEANISVGKSGELGTKVEIKNLNSFRAMERAVEYEIRRQSDLLTRGEKVMQETRGWNESTQSTFAQRTKEGSADYRYFPDPDLPSLRLSEIQEFKENVIRSNLPELPEEKKARYIGLGLKKEDAAMFAKNSGFGQLFDTASERLDEAATMFMGNLIANNLAGLTSATKDRDIEDQETFFSAEIPISPENLRAIVDMVVDGRLTKQAGKELLAHVVSEKLAPEVLAKKKGLLQAAQGDLEPMVAEVLATHQQVVADFKAGKQAALQFLIGQVMRKAKGTDPKKVREALESKLS